MKILIVDGEHCGLSLAWRCVQAGHEVRWFLLPTKNSHPDAGKGFKGITKVNNWVANAMWADLIVPTGNAVYLDRLDFFRAKGKRVFGPTAASAALEINRKAGMGFMKKNGIELAPYQSFKSIKDAAKHIEKTKDRFVFKTMGDEEDKSKTYVSKHAADMLGWMQKLDANGENPKGEVMLQEFVKGIEFGVSRFMGKDGWVGPYNESFEHKKLMSGNHGCNTGEMGTIASFVGYSKIGEELLGPLEKDLMKLGHIGDTAIGFMIDDAGKPYPTEFTMRLGWPIFNLMLGAVKGDPAQWMADACDGKDTTNFSHDIGCCLVVATKDFLNKAAGHENSSGTPVYGVTKHNKKYLYPHDIKIDPLPDMVDGEIVTKPMWNTAGAYCMVVTGYGHSVKQAAERAYKTEDQLHIADAIVRDDVGEQLEKDLPKLHKLGYATHFDYER